MKRLFFYGLLHPALVVFLCMQFMGAPSESEGDWAWTLLRIVYFPTSLLFSKSQSNMWFLMVGLGHWIALDAVFSSLKKAFKGQSRRPPGRPVPSRTSSRCTDCGGLFFPDPHDTPQDLCPRCRKGSSNSLAEDPTSRDAAFEASTPSSPRKEDAGDRRGLVATGMVLVLVAVLSLAAMAYLTWSSGGYWGFYVEKETVRTEHRWVDANAFVEGTHVPYNATEKAYETWVLVQYLAGGEIHRFRFRPSDVKRTYTTRWEALEQMKHYRKGKPIRIYYDALHPEHARFWTSTPPPSLEKERVWRVSPLILCIAVFGVSSLLAMLCLRTVYKGYRIAAWPEDGPSPAPARRMLGEAWAVIRAYTVVYVLLALGAVFVVVYAEDVDPPGPLENPLALHRAAGKGRMGAVEALIQRGARLNERNQAGFTPLHLAAMGGHARVIDLLVGSGARVNARDSFRRTPLDLAQTEAVRKALRKYGGKTAGELKQKPEANGKG